MPDFPDPLVPYSRVDHDLQYSRLNLGSASRSLASLRFATSPIVLRSIRIQRIRRLPDRLSVCLSVCLFVRSRIGWR